MSASITHILTLSSCYSFADFQKIGYTSISLESQHIPYPIPHYLYLSGVAACTSKTHRQSNGSHSTTTLLFLPHLQISAWLLHYHLLLLQSLLAYPLRCTSTSPPRPSTSPLSHIPPHRSPSSSSPHFLLSQLRSKYSPIRMTPQNKIAFPRFFLGHRIVTTKILAPLPAKSPP